MRSSRAQCRHAVRSTWPRLRRRSRGCGRRSGGLAYAPDLRGRKQRGRRPSSTQGARPPEPRRAGGRHLGTPVEQNGCGSLVTLGDATPQHALSSPNLFARLVMVGEERKPLLTSSVRLAKAKVAGSNPVFRSNEQAGSTAVSALGPVFSFRAIEPGRTARLVCARCHG